MELLAHKRLSMARRWRLSIRKELHLSAHKHVDEAREVAFISLERLQYQESEVVCVCVVYRQTHHIAKIRDLNERPLRIPIIGIPAQN